jgi:hypothetical protein
MAARSAKVRFAQPEDGEQRQMTTAGRHTILLCAGLLLAATGARAQAGKTPRLQQAKSGASPSGAESSQSGAAAPGSAPTSGAQPAPTNGSAPSPGAQPVPTVPQATPIKPPQPLPFMARFGRFDLEQPLAQLAQLAELKSCAAALAAPMGHAECALTANDEKIAKLNLAWDDTRAGGELLALRLTFDPQLAPPLTDLEFQLTRAWGSPALEQLRRDHDNKIFTLQWEDGDHRAALEAAGPLSQPARAVAIVLERKPHPLSGELATLRPKPFANMRVRMARRLDYDAQPYAILWGTSLTASQEALGESGPTWAAQRSYIGLFKLDPPGAIKRRWKPLWERTSGDEEDNDLQKITHVETREVTGDSDPDLLVEFSCPTCGERASELVVKTVRAGKAVDLLDKHDLYRARVDARVGQIRIREAEGDDAVTVSTYVYDKSKGAFVLAREERESEHSAE